MASYSFQTIIATTATIILFVIILLVVSRATKRQRQLMGIREVGLMSMDQALASR